MYPSSLVILFPVLDDLSLLGGGQFVIILSSPFEEVYSGIVLDFEFDKKYAATLS
jgi:hypothetical protein